MALLSRIKSPDWQDGDILTAADLKAEFNNIINGLNGLADIAVIGITATGAYSGTSSSLTGNSSVGGTLSVTGNIKPTSDATSTLGDSSHNFKSIFLDNSSTDGGIIAFNSDGSELKATANGAILAVGGFTDISPNTSGGQTLGATQPFGSLALSTNIGTNTPSANKLYADLVPKAWGLGSSAGSLTAGVNINFSAHGSTGVYSYTFKTNMADANYAIMTDNGAGGGAYSDWTTKSNSGFTIETRDVGGSLANAVHSFVIFGTQ